MKLSKKGKDEAHSKIQMIEFNKKNCIVFPHLLTHCERANIRKSWDYMCNGYEIRIGR